MSFSPTARPSLDQLESRDVATLGLLSSLCHGVSLLACNPEPVQPCAPVSLPKCDIKIDLPTCSLPKIDLPKCEPIKVELPKCEPPKVETPKCTTPVTPKQDDCAPKAEPKKDDCTPKAPPVCEVKKDDAKCDDKQEVKKNDCFTPADLVCKIVTAKPKGGFSLFGKC